MKEQPNLLGRLGMFVEMTLDRVDAAAGQTAEQDPDLAPIQVDEQSLLFALRLIGALCLSEQSKDDELRVAEVLMRAVHTAPMRVVMMSMNALRKMCKNPLVHKFCGESEQILGDISHHMDSGIRHLMKEKASRPIRRAAAELLFTLTAVPKCLEMIETTCNKDYLILERPLGDVIGACLKIADLTPEEAPELRAAALGVMFNAAAQAGTAMRIADEPMLVSFAIPLIGVFLDHNADDFIPRQRLQEYAVGLLSNVATLPATVPRLVQHVATVSPNGVRDLTDALHNQLSNAAACLTTTAEERWEYTQTTEKQLSGCYAAAALSKLTTHPDVRAASIIKRDRPGTNDAQEQSDFEAGNQVNGKTPRMRTTGTTIHRSPGNPGKYDSKGQALQPVVSGSLEAVQQQRAEAQLSEVDPDVDVIDDDDRKGTNAMHRALDKEWWVDTLSYECPISQKMFRLLDNEDAMADPNHLGYYAAITLWHLTSSPEDDQRVRRTIGSATNCWMSLANCIRRPVTTTQRKQPDPRMYVVSTMWNLLRVSEFQPKFRYTDSLMKSLLHLVIGIAKEDPDICFGDQIPGLRKRVAGLLTELVKDAENAKLLGADSELHRTLVSWLDVEEFEEHQLAKSQEQNTVKSKKAWLGAAKSFHVTGGGKGGSMMRMQALAHAKQEEAIEFEKKHSFADRTIHVRYVAKRWIDEHELQSRFAAEYGGVCGAIVRVKCPDSEPVTNKLTGKLEPVWMMEGEVGYHVHQSWALVTFDHGGVVDRIFQHPHNPKVVLEKVLLKADPDEVNHVGVDHEVVFEICQLNAYEAINSVNNHLCVADVIFC